MVIAMEYVKENNIFFDIPKLQISTTMNKIKIAE
jgi:hypothetical protein